MKRLRCGGVGRETIQVGTIYDVLDKISTVDFMEGNGVVMLGNVVNCEYWIATQLATSKLATMKRSTGVAPANGIYHCHCQEQPQGCRDPGPDCQQFRSISLMGMKQI